MIKHKVLFLLGLTTIFSNTSMVAQTASSDFMQSIGKIYVVVAVILSVFIGLIIFLINLERKVKQLEDQLED